MEKIEVSAIGKTGFHDRLFTVEIDELYRAGLMNIEGFGFLQVLWWGHLYAKPAQRRIITVDKPYKKGPDKLGVFATRSPVRPNPLLLSVIQVIRIDAKAGIIYTPYIDAEPGSPVVDIKPYHGSDRIKNLSVPDWCKHWPEWYEDSAAFDWHKEFNF